MFIKVNKILLAKAKSIFLFKKNCYYAKIFKTIYFEEIDFYLFYANLLSKKENQDKKVLVGFNGIDGKEVSMSKLKDDINEIRDSKSTFI